MNYTLLYMNILKNIYYIYTHIYLFIYYLLKMYLFSPANRTSSNFLSITSTTSKVHSRNNWIISLTYSLWLFEAPTASDEIGKKDKHADTEARFKFVHILQTEVSSTDAAKTLNEISQVQLFTTFNIHL